MQGLNCPKHLPNLHLQASKDKGYTTPLASGLGSGGGEDPLTTDETVTTAPESGIIQA